MKSMFQKEGKSLYKGSKLGEKRSRLKSQIRLCLKSLFIWLYMYSDLTLAEWWEKKQVWLMIRYTQPYLETCAGNVIAWAITLAMIWQRMAEGILKWDKLSAQIYSSAVKFIGQHFTGKMERNIKQKQSGFWKCVKVRFWAMKSQTST